MQYVAELGFQLTIIDIFAGKTGEVRIFESLSNLNINRPIVTIGSFDGVHLGHRQVISQLTAHARTVGGSSVVITFHPHPAAVLNPGKNFPVLSTIDEKKLLMAETGVDCLIVLPFTKEFSLIAYPDFVRDYLVRQLGIDTLLVGYDNKLGRDGLGRYEEVEALSRQYGFQVKRLEALAADEQPISSTMIRGLLAEGKVAEAAKLLGRDYSLTGRVVGGNHIGTSLGFPTANLEPDECKFVPCNGVYAIRATIDGRQFLGMLNIGNRPTVNHGDEKPTIEANLFGFEGNIYGTNLTISFLEKIRNERRFCSVDELRAQLEKDCRLIEGKFGE